jgi:hypothetical protein
MGVARPYLPKQKTHSARAKHRGKKWGFSQRMMDTNQVGNDTGFYLIPDHQDARKWDPWRHIADSQSPFVFPLYTRAQ